MLKKKYFVLAIIAVYLLSFLSIFTLFGAAACTDGSLCVRFCCRNATTCSDKFIRENFNESIPEYNIVKGRPKCQLILEKSKPEFDAVKHN